jgi:transposase
LLLQLLAENRFPRIWMPSTEQRDLRTLLRHRHQWVRMRSRVQHTLQSVALNQGLRLGRSLWSQAGQQALRALPLAPHASQRRAALLSLYPGLQESIDALDQQVSEQAQQRPQARRLMTHPGVGPVTALATEVFLGDPLLSVVRGGHARRTVRSGAKAVLSTETDTERIGESQSCGSQEARDPAVDHAAR